tara:strand:- start:20 stop:655 length:636 start_codon:yes stop_codon:yes gene_type:complete
MKFVLVSTARAGSSFVVRNLAKKFNIDFNYDEILNNKRMYEFFERFGKGTVYVKNNRLVKLNSNTDNFYERQLQSWIKSDVVSCKLLAHQILKAPNHVTEGILNDADCVAYLYRKDSTAQVYSAIISKKLKQHLPRVKTENKTFIDITQEDFNSQSQDLLESNLCIKELLGKYPGKVYCLEDDFENKPYADTYNYNKNFIYNLQNIQDLFT